MKWVEDKVSVATSDETKCDITPSTCADVNAELKLCRWTLYAAYPTHDSMLASDDEMRNRYGTADEADLLNYPVEPCIHPSPRGEGKIGTTTVHTINSQTI